jgi:hypothetical protein
MQGTPAWAGKGAPLPPVLPRPKIAAVEQDLMLLQGPSRLRPWKDYPPGPSARALFREANKRHIGKFLI